jgi:hypothetical protein
VLDWSVEALGRAIDGMVMWLEKKGGLVEETL